jgi:dihydroxy-acid dehydratase
MATVMELIGLSPMGTAAVPQVDKRKEDVARRCGEIVMDAVRNNIRRAISARARLSRTPSPAWRPPADRPTPCCTCWPWRAKPEVPLSIDDFETICARTPIFVDLKPAGRFMAADVDKAGGMGRDRQAPGGRRLVDGSALTVTGRTFAEEAADARRKLPDRK